MVNRGGRKKRRKTTDSMEESGGCFISALYILVARFFIIPLLISYMAITETEILYGPDWIIRILTIHKRMFYGEFVNCKSRHTTTKIVCSVSW
jgi:hypothetical protein